MKKLQIWFWKAFACIWDLRPRLHLPQYVDRPILITPIADKYDYPEGMTVLFEWDEKGHHWIVVSR